MYLAIQDLKSGSYKKLNIEPSYIDIISVISGLSIEWIAQLPPKEIGRFFYVISFLEQPITKPNKTYSDKLDAWNIKRQTYAAYVDACTYMDEVKEGQSYQSKITEILACFAIPKPYDFELMPEYQNEVFALPVNYALPLFSKVINQIVNESEYLRKNIKTIEYTPEQLRAGIKKLETQGVLNVLNNLSGGDITKNEAILNMSVGEVHAYVIDANKRANYEKKYNEIINQNQK